MTSIPDLPNTTPLTQDDLLIYRDVSTGVDRRGKVQEVSDLVSEFVTSEADRAETAAEVAAAAGRVFTTTADGIAATVDGDYFWVVSAESDETLELWLNDGEVASDTGKRTVSSVAVENNTTAINNRVIRVGSVAEMESLPTVAGYQAILSGLRAGKFKFDDGDLSAEVIGDPLQGIYIAPDSDPTGASGAWVRQEVGAATPEMFGAAGDGITDDTAPVKAWWESSNKTLIARGKYLISGTDEFMRTVSDEDFFYRMTGAEFTIAEPRAYLFRCTINGAGRNVCGFGGQVNGQNNVARPIEIKTSGVSAGTIVVNKFIASNVFANDGLSFSSSAIGVNVSAEASQIFVTGCRVSGVDRAYVNPGSVSSVGISVTNVIGSASITDNVVNDVWSPAGDADADGITVFSRDRLLVGRQIVKIEITGNRLTDCKGRFIKLQTTEAHVWGNRFDSMSGELILGFRAIDCQFGGCNIHNNFWNLFASVTGMDEGVFVLTQFKDAGNWESRTVVRDNFIVLERELLYLVRISLTGGVSQIEVHDNDVKANQSTDFLTSNLVRVDTTDITAVTSSRIEIRNNTYPSDRDPVLQMVGADFSGVATTADVIELEITDNTNTRVPVNVRDTIVEVAAADTVPYLKNFVLRGNNTGGQHRLNAKSVDLDVLPIGNAFYYGTDGSTGGMTNAPSGYNRFVHVCTQGREQILGANSNDAFAKRIEGSATWYEYTGAAL